MNSTKPELRKSLQKARMDLGEGARQRKSEAIVAGLRRSVDWSEVRRLHCFEPIERLGEVDLSSFLADLRDAQPYIQIYTSRKIGGEWQIVPIDSGKPAADMPRFDAVIVPMLGFEPRLLHRIGYGGGYYDKFLAAQPQARKIGVCFEAGKLARLPVEPQDIPLDTIITESQIYTS